MASQKKARPEPTLRPFAIPKDAMHVMAGFLTDRDHVRSRAVSQRWLSDLSTQQSWATAHRPLKFPFKWNASWEAHRDVPFTHLDLENLNYRRWNLEELKQLVLDKVESVNISMGLRQAELVPLLDLLSHRCPRMTRLSIHHVVQPGVHFTEVWQLSRILAVIPTTIVDLELNSDAVGMDRMARGGAFLTPLMNHLESLSLEGVNFTYPIGDVPPIPAGGHLRVMRLKSCSAVDECRLLTDLQESKVLEELQVTGCGSEIDLTGFTQILRLHTDVQPQFLPGHVTDLIYVSSHDEAIMGLLPIVMPDIKTLTLEGIHVPALSSLVPLRELTSLTIKYTGSHDQEITQKITEFLPNVPQLTHLKVVMPAHTSRLGQQAIVAIRNHPALRHVKIKQPNGDWEFHTREAIRNFPFVV